MELSKLVYMIKSSENGEQKFRDWLFCVISDLPSEYSEMIKKYFKPLRDIIKNNIAITDIYEAKNKSSSYEDVVICEKIPLRDVVIEDEKVYMALLCLIFYDILRLFYDSEHSMYFVPLNPTNIKNIENTKKWWTGSNYQIEKEYKYEKGDILNKDIKIFEFKISKDITNEKLLNIIL